MAVLWVLAGKDIFKRWRCWRGPGAVLPGWGCGCFQSFFGPSPAERGVSRLRIFAWFGCDL